MAKSSLLRRLEALEKDTSIDNKERSGIDTFAAILTRYMNDPNSNDAMVSKFKGVLYNYNSKTTPYGEIVTELLKCKHS